MVTCIVLIVPVDYYTQQNECNAKQNYTIIHYHFIMQSIKNINNKNNKTPTPITQRQPPLFAHFLDSCEEKI